MIDFLLGTIVAYLVIGCIVATVTFQIGRKAITQLTKNHGAWYRCIVFITLAVAWWYVIGKASDEIEKEEES